MARFDDLIIRETHQVREAMQRMTAIRCGLLFVCDENLRLIGALSDGDIRRALLDDTQLLAPVVKVMNTDPFCARTVEQAEAALREQGLLAIPVVDAESRITHIVLLVGAKITVLESARQPGGEAPGAGEALVVIPARGGSKRVPRKNLQRVAGRSLVVRAIETSLAARVGPVLVSTDDEEIAAVSRATGALVPWLRPAELATDSARTVDVLLHAARWSRQLDAPPRAMLLVEPTAPLREPKHLVQALELLESSDADCVMSVSEVPHVLNPDELVVIVDGEVMPYSPRVTRLADRPAKHLLQPVYCQNGLVYAIRIDSLLRTESIYGDTTLPLVTPWETFLDVDTAHDLAVADYRLSHDRG